MAMAWRTGAGPGGLTCKRPGHDSILIHHRIELTDNCPRRLTSEDDGVRRHPDKMWCNTQVGEICTAPGVRAN